MENFEKLFTLFLFALINSIFLVDATFSKSMYITWGAQHALLQGEDLQLVLDKTSGRIKLCTYNLHQRIKLCTYVCLCNTLNFGFIKKIIYG